MVMSWDSGKAHYEWWSRGISYSSTVVLGGMLWKADRQCRLENLSQERVR